MLLLQTAPGLTAETPRWRERIRTLGHRPTVSYLHLRARRDPRPYRDLPETGPDDNESAIQTISVTP
jgi:hypothetical protein